MEAELFHEEESRTGIRQLITDFETSRTSLPRQLTNKGGHSRRCMSNFRTACDIAIGRQSLAMKRVCAGAQRDPRYLETRRKRRSRKNTYANTS